MPFAVIGSDREVAVGGKKILGRQTKWGFIEVENKKHCEFSQLRDMLIRWVWSSRLPGRAFKWLYISTCVQDSHAGSEGDN